MSVKTKLKVILAVILALVISIGSISAYKYITTPKEESIPLETTLEDAAELTTQKMIIFCVVSSAASSSVVSSGILSSFGVVIYLYADMEPMLITNARITASITFSFVFTDIPLFFCSSFYYHLTVKYSFISVFPYLLCGFS